MGTMDPATLLEGLDPEQRAAAVAVGGPVCILAGAGTGKTRTITHRIAYAVTTGAVQPEHVLAVTFTARAAGELRARLRGLGVERVQARTFHAAALRQLQYFWPRVVGGAFPTLLDSKFPLVNAAAGRARLRLDPAGVRDAVAEIEWAKARMVAPEGYVAAAAGRTPPGTPEQMAQVYAGYEESKRRGGSVDFDDLLLLTAAAVEEHDDVAEEVQSRYRHFVVDEYQDVNPLQQRLLDAWLGGRDELCVVGDDDQTIYSFTGASRDYLLRFSDRYPEAVVVRLVRDYRSTPQVVGLANSVIAGDTTRRGAPKRLVAQLPDGPAPTFSEHDSEPEEARSVARRITELIEQGIAASEVAILYRVNAQSAGYEAALGAAGIPYVVRGGERFFDRKEVREAVAALRAASRAPDPDTTLADAVSSVLAERLDWHADKPPAGSGAARDRWEGVAALARLAGDLPDAGLQELVAELDQRIADQHAPTVDGVTLASLHAAKGLEWDAVFLVGLVDGTMPLQHALTPDAVAEERRLLYVGITRARTHLALSWALARNEGGRRGRKRTRFLDNVLGAPVRATPTPAAARSKGPSTCRTCGTPLIGKAARAVRRCAACPSTVDEDLLLRLRDWRRAQAVAAELPAYCVFTDATLEAIAEGRPSDVTALAKISGVGPAKLDKYGRDVLELVANR
jgi:DNA helicase-2/ATP-dependent DNA helicase PcrA